MNEVISPAADNVQNANGDSVDGAYNAWDHIRADAVFLANSVVTTAAWGGLTAGASAHPGATPTITAALGGATCIWSIREPITGDDHYQKT